ncbi:hypothetical protein [Pseudobutyrivibrio ruminis]|uniref:hypothetical protein n=1 Tax=Pseudobutyrivibrio ruminis TaxID=46206 RepID=UPI00051C1884|nr:hypothetical protein [Pseudobutyrivibrio ruminis]
MTDKYLKNMFTELSEQDRLFVEGVIIATASLNQETFGEALLKLFKEVTLPKDVDAEKICWKLYSSQINSIEALRQFFGVTSSRFSLNNQYPNYALEAVELLRKLSVNKECSFRTENQKIEFASAITSMQLHLQSDEIEPSLSGVFKRIEDTLNMYNSFEVETLLASIICHWDVVVQYPETLDITCLICNILQDTHTETPRDTAETAWLIKSLAANWGNQ